MIKLPPSSGRVERQVLHALFGGTRAYLAWLILSMIVAVGWFADGVLHLVNRLVGLAVNQMPTDRLPAWLPSWSAALVEDLRQSGGYYLLMLAAPLFVMLLLRRARRYVPNDYAVVRPVEPLEPRRVLISFLSKLTLPEYRVALQNFDEHGDATALADLVVDARAERRRSGKNFSWYMTLRSALPHLQEGGLDLWLVVGSAPSPPPDNPRGKPQAGSLAQFAGFRAMVEALRERDARSDPDLAGVERLPTPEDAGAFLGGAHARGARFDDGESVLAVLRSLHERLGGAHHYHHRDVTVDITGGLAVTSAIATAATIARDRTFQYVHTEDYTVRQYVMRYEPEPVGHDH